MPSPALNKYLNALDELRHIRLKHDWAENEEEDKLTDKMDKLWLKLTEEERARVNALPSQPKAKFIDSRRSRLL